MQIASLTIVVTIIGLFMAILFPLNYMLTWLNFWRSSSALIARFMGPTWGPSGADKTHVGPMLAPWTLLSGWFCKCAPPWMLPPLDFPFDIWIEQVTFGLLYVMFRSSTRTFYRGFPGFAIDCPYDVWCRRLTNCLLYIGPLFGNEVWNDSGFVSFA